MYPFEFGWTAREELSEEERASGMALGQGMFIIDRDGIVTAHSSLPPPLIVSQYVEARRQGRIIGREVWPNPAPDNRSTTPPVPGTLLPPNSPRPGPMPPTW